MSHGQAHHRVDLAIADRSALHAARHCCTCKHACRRNCIPTYGFHYTCCVVPVCTAAHITYGNAPVMPALSLRARAPRTLHLGQFLRVHVFLRTCWLNADGKLAGLKSRLLASCTACTACALLVDDTRLLVLARCWGLFVPSWLPLCFFWDCVPQQAVGRRTLLVAPYCCPSILPSRALKVIPCRMRGFVLMHHRWDPTAAVCSACCVHVDTLR